MSKILKGFSSFLLPPKRSKFSLHANCKNRLQFVLYFVIAKCNKYALFSPISVFFLGGGLIFLLLFNDSWKRQTAISPSTLNI